MLLSCERSKNDLGKNNIHHKHSTLYCSETSLMKKYFDFVFFTSMVAFLLKPETFIRCKNKVYMSQMHLKELCVRLSSLFYTCLLPFD